MLFWDDKSGISMNGKLFPNDSSSTWWSDDWLNGICFSCCALEKRMLASICVSQGYSRFFELLLVFFLLSSASLNPLVGTSGVNVRAPFMIARCCYRSKMSRMSVGECFVSHFGDSSRCLTIKHYLWNIPRKSHAWQEREEKKDLRDNLFISLDASWRKYMNLSHFSDTFAYRDS